jgi:predicted nucleotidyltransferase
MELIIGIISTVIAVLAALISLWSLQENRRIVKQQINLDLLQFGHELMKEKASILRFHGIDEEELKKKYKVDIVEFIYLLNSFYAGQAFHEVNKTAKITISPYREQMLKSENVKAIWQDLIRNKLMYASKYAKAIDQYYNIN